MIEYPYLCIVMTTCMNSNGSIAFMNGQMVIFNNDIVFGLEMYNRQMMMIITSFSWASLTL